MKLFASILLLILSCFSISNKTYAQETRDTVDCSDQLILGWVETGGGIYKDVVNDVTTDDDG
ncbi:MAG: hypothetical protein PHE33_10095, partial [Bacteroidales bacterium]|nr:hypothetical protein [Bacteroidales bacterium]